jgi:hypothetical protein
MPGSGIIFSRIRILPNVSDPSGFGSTTLLCARSFPKFLIYFNNVASLCAETAREGVEWSRFHRSKNAVFFAYSCSMHYSDCLGADEVQLWASSPPHSSLSTFQETQVIAIHYTMVFFRTFCTFCLWSD